MQVQIRSGSSLVGIADIHHLVCWCTHSSANKTERRQGSSGLYKCQAPTTYAGPAHANTQDCLWLWNVALSQEYSHIWKKRNFSITNKGSTVYLLEKQKFYLHLTTFTKINGIQYQKPLCNRNARRLKKKTTLTHMCVCGQPH